MSKQQLLGIYKDYESFMEGMNELKNNNIDIAETYTPFPLSEESDFLKRPRNNNMLLVAIISGIVGLIISVSMILYMNYNYYNWRINNETEILQIFFANIYSYIYIIFIMIVLFSAVGATMTFFYFNKKSLHNNIEAEMFLKYKETFIIKTSFIDDNQYNKIISIFNNTYSLVVKKY